MKFGTKAIHEGFDSDPATGAIMPPIYQTSTYVQASPGVHKGFEYSRTQNPTRSFLQKNIASLEDAKHGLCFASGLAATDAILKLLEPGDEVISNNNIYGGTYRIFTKIFAKYGIKFYFIDMAEANAVGNYINPNTKLIWIETPSNPLMNIIDIKSVSAIAKKHPDYSGLLAVDNTFATPYLQNPMGLGADIVMHSATKYLSGHSDVIMGAVVCDNAQLHERLFFIQNSCGAVPAPMDCFLVLRGIKTLHLRMERHCENARAVANYLSGHPKIGKVYWPGLESHPNHSVAKSQMRGFGGMLSFILKDNSPDAAIKLVSKTKIFKLAESLGGVESLVGHPAKMTHSSIPKEEREKAGLSDSLIRLSVGVENIEDIIADLEQAIG